MTWRRLESEIVAIARSEGFQLDEDQFGDKIIVDTQGYDLNLTILAQKLSDRGVTFRRHK
jgi:hypothetical protein